MTKWFLSFRPEAEDDLSKLDKKLQERIVAKLGWLERNFENIIPLALSHESKRSFKLRVSAWRIIYKVDWSKKAITVCIIDRRDKIYKRNR